MNGRGRHWRSRARRGGERYGLGESHCETVVAFTSIVDCRAESQSNKF